MRFFLTAESHHYDINTGVHIHIGAYTCTVGSLFLSLVTLCVNGGTNQLLRFVFRTAESHHYDINSGVHTHTGACHFMRAKQGRKQKIFLFHVTCRT